MDGCGLQRRQPALERVSKTVATWVGASFYHAIGVTQSDRSRTHSVRPFAKQLKCVTSTR